MLGAAPSHAAGNTLTIWVGSGEVAAYQAGSAAWAKANNVTLNIVAKCGLGDCDMAKLAPTGAGPDLVEIGHDSTGGLVKSGLVDSIGTTFNKSLFPASITQGVAYNYSVWGVPLLVSNIALATNLSLVPSGAPKTWNELEGTSLALIASGKANVGIVTHLDGYFMQPFVSSLGGYVFQNKSGTYFNTKKVGLYSPELAKNAGLMDKWLKEKLFDKANTYDTSDFTNGKAPYALVGPWSIDGLDKAGVKYKISSIPGVNGTTASAFSSVTALFMSHFSKQKLLARSYLVGVAQTVEFQSALAKSKNTNPAMISAAALVDPTSPGGGFAACGQLSTPAPNIPQMNLVWTYWNNAFADWAAGKSAFGPAMKIASQNLTTALAGS